MQCQLCVFFGLSLRSALTFSHASSNPWTPSPHPLLACPNGLKASDVMGTAGSCGEGGEGGYRVCGFCGEGVRNQVNQMLLGEGGLWRGVVLPGVRKTWGSRVIMQLWGT